MSDPFDIDEFVGEVSAELGAKQAAARPPVSQAARVFGRALSRVQRDAAGRDSRDRKTRTPMVYRDPPAVPKPVVDERRPL